MQLTEKTFQTGEITLTYDEGEANGPPMVLLHGLTSMRLHWRANFIPAYADAWHLYAVDLRGHGMSSHASDDEAYRVGDYVGDIVAFIESEVEEPPVIIGHSLGAMVAIGVGAALGDRVRGLLLLDPPLPVRDSDITIFPEANGWFSWIRETLSNEPSIEQVVDACRKINPALQDEMLQAMATQVHRLSIGTVRTALQNRIAENFDFAEALQNITCPVMLMYAEFGQSGSTRESDVEFMSKHTPKFTHIKFPYDDHAFFRNHWDETRPHVTAFLQKLSSNPD